MTFALFLAAGLARLSTAHALGVEPNGKVSFAPFGGAINGKTFGAAMTGDSRFVVYASAANNIVAGDTNNQEDVFRYDRLLAWTTPISLGPQLNFAAGRSGLTANSNGITPDGRFVLFYSDAPLVAGDTNAKTDVFVRDTSGAGSTRRVSVTNDGAQLTQSSYPIGLTGDGRYAFFVTKAALDNGDANNADDVYRRDLVANTTMRITPSAAGGTSSSSVSRDGRYIAFSIAPSMSPKDTNSLRDVYLRDIVSGGTTLISVDGNGSAVGGDYVNISADGDAIGFQIPSTGVARVYFRSSNTFRTVAPASPDANPLAQCAVRSFSQTGRYAAVHCAHIYPGTASTWISQGFCVDLTTGTSRLFSRSAAGQEGNNAAESMHMSDDGKTVAMTSAATNLIPNDTNGVSDAFVAQCQ